MHESEPVTPVMTQEAVTTLVVKLSRAVEQTGELLEAATELHRKVAELHGALAEPLVDLENLLRESQAQTSKEPG